MSQFIGQQAPDFTATAVDSSSAKTSLASFLDMMPRSPTTFARSVGTMTVMPDSTIFRM